MKYNTVLKGAESSVLGYNDDHKLDLATNHGFDKYDIRNNYKHSPLHLFIISKDFIATGDWMYNLINGEILKCDTYNSENDRYLYKITASTDLSIISLDGVMTISMDIIKQFIKDYNNGYRDIKIDLVIKETDIVIQQTYTRAEVDNLLELQRKKCADQYYEFWIEDHIKTRNTLKDSIKNCKIEF